MHVYSLVIVHGAWDPQLSQLKDVCTSEGRAHIISDDPDRDPPFEEIDQSIPKGVIGESKDANINRVLSLLEDIGQPRLVLSTRKEHRFLKTRLDLHEL